MIGLSRVAANASAFAYIKVRYPAGSTCIATNGLRTLRAKNTSGLWIFEIPRPVNLPEEWIIQAEEGTLSSTKTIQITNKSQCIESLLKFTLYLIKQGKLTTEYSLSAEGGTYTEKEGGWVLFHHETNAYGTYYFDNTILLTKFKTISITCVAGDYNRYKTFFGISDSKIKRTDENVNNFNIVHNNIPVTSNKATPGTYLLEYGNAVLDAYYLGLSIAGSGSNGANTNISEWKLL